ncbi:MAG: type II secretion system F family protein [Candidatus Omnitrophica bacterium]|nr:type II secretion system F family protein [Candidatus Omnitrophota bacterium]
MPIYYYKARSHAGEVLTGELEGPSQSEIASILQRKGLFVTTISNKPIDKKTEAKQIKREEATSALKKEIVLFGRISGEDKMVFTIQLANMVSAGLTLVKSLNIIVRQMKNPKFRSVLTSVYENVEGGMAFSDALEKFPKVFPPYFTSSVKAGEASGQLGPVLERVASFTEHDMDVKQNIQAALTYPIILIVVGGGIVFFILTGVIPSFVSTFLRIGIELPIPTQIMYKLSTFLKTQWMLVLLSIGGGVLFFRGSSATAIGKEIIDRIKLNIPVAGLMVERFCLSRFARTLGMLLNCGVPMLLAIKISQRNVENKIYEKAIDIVHEDVRQGIKMADSLKEAKVFPVDLIQMVAVGEETGHLDQLLNRLGDYYDTTAKYAVKKFMALLEPVFLLVLGTFIAFIMAAVLLPIFDMMRLLRQGT